MTDPVLLQQTIQAAQAASDSSIPDAGIWAGAITALPVGIWWIVRFIRRVESRDTVDRTKDKAETDVVKTLQEENSRLRSSSDRLQERLEKVSDERNEAVQQLGRFVAEAEMNRQKIEELQKSIQSMSLKLETQSALLQKVLLENSELKGMLNNSFDTNKRLESDIVELKQAIHRLETN